MNVAYWHQYLILLCKESFYLPIEIIKRTDDLKCGILIIVRSSFGYSN